MPKRSRKQIRDLNVLAAHIVEQATGQPIPKNVTEESAKNPAAVALGHLGGLKGGRARASKLTAQQRIESAKKAANARWAKKTKDQQ